MTGTRSLDDPNSRSRSPANVRRAALSWRRRLVAAALVLGALVTARPARAQDAVSRSLVLRGVTVIDPSSSAEPRTDQVIVIVDGVIRAVGPVGKVTIPDGVAVIDATGRYAIPGLWDMHVHLADAGASALSLLVANGVTSVRDVGGSLDSTRAWRARIEAGTLAGPRIRTSGPILESPAYLRQVRDADAALGGGLAPRVIPYSVGIGTAADAHRVVDSLARAGVDFIEVRTVASPEAYFAILAAARAAGLGVAGHAPLVVSLVTASDSGQKNLEHAFEPPLSRVDSASRAGIYRHLVRGGTWYTPTLVASRRRIISGDSALRSLAEDLPLRRRDARRVYASPSLLAWWRVQAMERQADTSAVRRDSLRELFHSSIDDVRALRQAGARLLAGTDAGSLLVYPGFSLHEELRLMVEEGGLSAREALWSATVGPAQYFGMDATLGTIAPGKLADIVLLSANPLADIHSTHHIYAVIQGGRLLDQDALRALLVQVRDAARP